MRQQYALRTRTIVGEDAHAPMRAIDAAKAVSAAAYVAPEQPGGSPESLPVKPPPRMPCIPQTHASQDKRSFEGARGCHGQCDGDCRAFSVNKVGMRGGKPVCDKLNSWSWAPARTVSRSPLMRSGSALLVGAWVCRAHCVCR